METLIYIREYPIILKTVSMSFDIQIYQPRIEKRK